MRCGITSLQVVILPQIPLFVLLHSQFSIFFSYDSAPIFLRAALFDLPPSPCSHLLNPNVCSYALSTFLHSGSFCPIKQSIYLQNYV